MPTASTPVANRRLALLLGLLNENEITYPGTNLTMVFAQVTAATIKPEWCHRIFFPEVRMSELALADVSRYRRDIDTSRSAALKMTMSRRGISIG